MTGDPAEPDVPGVDLVSHGPELPQRDEVIEVATSPGSIGMLLKSGAAA